MKLVLWGGVMLSMVFLLVWFLAVVCSLALTAFWVWMLVDCLTKMDNSGQDKLIWIVVIVFTNFMGALIYYCVQRPKNQAETWQYTDKKPSV